MQVTLLLGPPKSGKTQAVLDILAAENSPQDPLRALLIVPTKLDIGRVKERLAARGQAFFSAGIGTLEDAARRVLEANGVLSGILDDARRLWLLRQILRQMQAQRRLVFLKDAAENRGVLQEISEFIKELKHAEIFYPKLREGLRRKGPDPKDNEILELYARYQDALVRHRFFDREGLLWQAKSLLAKGGSLNGPQILLVDGFDSFTPTQLGFLEVLSRKMERACITLPQWDKGVRPHLEETRAQIQKIFRPQEKRLEPSAKTAALTLHEFRDIASEARWCAQKIKRLATENPEVLEGIAVCVRDLGLYENLLREEFQRCGLPVTPARSMPLAVTPMCLSLLAFVQAHLVPDLPSLLAVLESPLLEDGLAQRGMPPGEWIARVFREGFIEELTGDWKTRIRWVLDEKLPQHARAFANLPEAFEKCWKEFRQWPRLQTLAEHSQTFRTRLEAWGMTDQNIAGLSSDLQKQWTPFWQALEGYGLFRKTWEAQDAEISLEEWRREIAPFFQQATVREQEPPRGVALLSAHAMRGASYRDVFVLGVNEDIFPKTAAVRLLHTAGERRRMREAGLELQEDWDPQVRRSQEAFLFSQVLSASTNTLFVSWHHSNPVQKECLPSSFFQELRSTRHSRESGTLPLKTIHSAQCVSAFGGQNLGVSVSSHLPADPGQWACAQDAINALFAQLCLSKARRAAYVPELVRQCRTWDSEKVSRLRQAVTLERQREIKRGFSEFDAQLRRTDVLTDIRKRFGIDSVSSASKLNEYAKCPFRFYSKYVLDIEPAQIPAGEITSAERGTLVHRILWKLFHRHFQEIHPLAENTLARFAALQEDLSAIAQGIFQDFRQAYGILHPRLWTWEEQRILERLKDFLTHEGGFLQENPNRIPTFFELSFGMPSEKEQDPSSIQEPVRLRMGKETLRLRGKIDRVDMEKFLSPSGPTRLGFWVLDYKTGNVKTGKKDLAEGRDVQLPIYLLGTQQLLEHKGVNAVPVGAALYKTWPPERKTNFDKDKKLLASGNLKDPEWEETLQQARQWIFRYAQQISQGRFTPTPPQCKCVYHCEYRSICRFDERRIERKQRLIETPALQEQMI